MKGEIIKKLHVIVKELTDQDIEVQLDIPSELLHGDFTTNISFQVAKILKISPREAAEKILEELQKGKLEIVEKTEVAGPGFINFYLSQEYLVTSAQEIVQDPENVGKSDILNKKIMVEYAHPNTHKEMHIGHMRTLITGEAVSRILEANGATVFRANYQGDIGPHVAKALYGIEKMIQEKGLSLDDVEEWSYKDKAHFLGEGYVRGNKDYDDVKLQINAINSDLYNRKPGHYWDLYHQTHKWSLDYYEEFYTRFYTKFDKLFLESQMYEKGKKIVESHIGDIFVKDADGSIIFPGEKYGLHTRVFITQVGNPTYEGKEMGNALAEWNTFHFDQKIHVVASEQMGYFQVVFKALELLDPEKFKDKQLHLSMGMVQFTDRKMSSRTGDILTVDWLLDEIKGAAEKLFSDNKISGDERGEVLENVTIASLKYSVLKGSVKQDAAFDINTSVSLDGNSGPYLQYTYVRTQSILGKSEEINSTLGDYQPQQTEILLLRHLSQFQLVVEKAGKELAPSTICTYLYQVAKQFNLFYQTYRINDAKTSSEKVFRLLLTSASGIVLRTGLGLLGIVAPNRM